LRQRVSGFAWLVAVSAGAVYCTGFSVQAQTSPPAKTMLVEPPAPLLPATLGKLTRTAEGNSGDGLEAVDPAQKPVLMEDGLKRYAQSDYTAGPNGPSRGSIIVYKFMDVSGAMCAYDYFRKPGMRPEKVGDCAVSSGDELIFRSGPDVVIEHLKLGHDEKAAVNTELIQHLPKALGPASLAPLLPTLLPAKGLDAESAHYALGPGGYQAMGGIVPKRRGRHREVQRRRHLDARTLSHTADCR